jgi:hypothetical protein
MSIPLSRVDGAKLIASIPFFASNDMLHGRSGSDMNCLWDEYPEGELRRIGRILIRQKRAVPTPERSGASHAASILVM